MTKYAVTSTVYATVTINDQRVVERAMTPEWQSQFYTFADEDEVVEHFAFNAISNGIHDIRRLDGWADCDKTDVLIEIDYIDHMTERLS